jgi:hypothetical protein
MTEEFRYMNQLKESISEKYGTEEVEVSLMNRTDLTVSLTGSQFNDYTPAEKRQISREIGELAQELKGDKNTIISGQVNFQDEQNYGIAKSSSTETFQMFE